MRREDEMRLFTHHPNHTPYMSYTHVLHTCPTHMSYTHVLHTCPTHMCPRQRALWEASKRRRWEALEARHARERDELTAQLALDERVMGEAPLNNNMV